MSLHLIDMDTYHRREHFEHFLGMQLTYSAAVEIDVTQLRTTAKARGYRAYPAQIWMLTTAANRVAEFRMSFDTEGALGVWDELHPVFTVFNDARRTFSSLWTRYNKDFSEFNRMCLQTIEQHNDGSLEPQDDTPANVLNVSSIPWVAFTGFNLNLPSRYLLPILTIGRYTERNGRTFMPLAVQVHHAVCDGWHLGQYIDDVQRIANSADAWMSESA